MKRSKLIGIAAFLLTVAPLLFSQSPHGITLNWGETNNTDAATGFNVYRSTTSGGPYSKLTATPLASTTLSYSDPQSNLVAGTKYFYVVTSVDSVGIESLFSNEVSGVALGSNPPVVTGATAH
jgi:fibronectin type 3 domain-containing protein